MPGRLCFRGPDTQVLHQLLEFILRMKGLAHVDKGTIFLHITRGVWCVKTAKSHTEDR
jgi:hypothetical protein